MAVFRAQTPGVRAAGHQPGQGFDSAMYHEYFGIPEDPFSITPDTRYLFFSERHRNAFAHLIYGVAEGGGFVQLTGEVGTGKTLLCRNLLSQLPNEVYVALIFNPRLTPLELVANICDELGIHYPLGCDSIKEIVDFLNAFLLEIHRQGHRTAVIIDEAQNLSFEALEQVRLLTNLETEKQKLLQIILVGQPELKRLLERPELRQLAQRVTARYHLTPLSADETRSYVLHRLKVAGMKDRVFTPGALHLLFKLSGGIPRLINVLCSRAMLAAYAAERQMIDRAMLRRVSRELAGENEIDSPPSRWGWVVAGILLLGAAGVLLQQTHWLRGAVPSVVNGEHVNQPAPMSAQSVADAVVPAEVRAAPIAASPKSTGDAAAATTAAFLAEEAPPLASRPSADNDSSLSLMGLLGDQNNAFATLFGYWQTVYPTDDETLPACERAERVGLSCIYGRGSWQNLEYYNRPAVIELLLDDGHRYHVVVTRLEGERVTLDLESRRLTFSRSEIDPLWTGSYIVLWRPPKLAADALSMGAKGRDVAWLVAILDRIEGVTTRYDPDAVHFDRAMKARVMKFQQSHGLISDGIVGRRTIIQLSLSVDDNPVPALKRREG
jgi:general secretion pathway protein A